MDGLTGWPRRGLSDVQIFTANSPTSTGTEDGGQIWRKRPGASMVSFFALGAGGSGGHGAVGAVSAAGGGGGGGSGAQIYTEIPAILLPDLLYVYVGVGGQAPAGTGGSTYVSIAPAGNIVANNTVLKAGGATGGATASGGSGGTRGTGGGTTAAGTMSLCLSNFQSIIGQDGIAGSNSGAGNTVTISTGTLRVTSGAGGAGLNGSGVAGSAGGAFVVAGVFPAHPGGLGGSAATTPPTGGANGYSAMPGCLYGFFYGGAGGGSSHGSATGAGLFGGNGGSGSYGCGGGGGGGALTGSTQGLGGRGGDGLVIISSW